MWTDEDIAHTGKMFSKVLFESFFERNKENYSQDEMEDIAVDIGREIYRLVKTHTDLDLHQFYK